MDTGYHTTGGHDPDDPSFANQRMPKSWASTDKNVGETANAIEAKYPGKVVDVNKITHRPDGTILTDFDIELNNTVIQVKAGTAKGLTTKITKTATGTSIDELIKQRFGTQNPGSAKEKTMLHAIKTGKIQDGEALRPRSFNLHYLSATTAWFTPQIELTTHFGSAF